MNDTPPDRPPSSRRSRGPLLAAGAVVLAFLIGFGWQWLEARDARSRLDEASRELEYQRLATTLASAVIQADRGAHDDARELASRFFTGLQGTVAGADAATGEELDGILERRDAVITALSRSSPESEDILTQMFVRYGAATGAADVGVPVSPPAGATQPAAGDTGGAGATTPPPSDGRR